METTENLENFRKKELSDKELIFEFEIFKKSDTTFEELFSVLQRYKQNESYDKELFDRISLEAQEIEIHRRKAA